MLMATMLSIPDSKKLTPLFQESRLVQKVSSCLQKSPLEEIAVAPTTSTGNTRTHQDSYF